MELHGLDTETHVFFYEQDFYVLSNFSAFTLQWKGIRFDATREGIAGVKLLQEGGTLSAANASQIALDELNAIDGTIRCPTGQVKVAALAVLLVVAGANRA